MAGPGGAAVGEPAVQLLRGEEGVVVGRAQPQVDLGPLVQGGTGHVERLDGVPRAVPQRSAPLRTQPLALLGDLVPPAGHVRGQPDLVLQHLDVDRLGRHRRLPVAFDDQGGRLQGAERERPPGRFRLLPPPHRADRAPRAPAQPVPGVLQRLLEQHREHHAEHGTHDAVGNIDSVHAADTMDLDVARRRRAPSVIPACPCRSSCRSSLLVVRAGRPCRSSVPGVPGGGPSFRNDRGSGPRPWRWPRPRCRPARWRRRTPGRCDPRPT